MKLQTKNDRAITKAMTRITCTGLTDKGCVRDHNEDRWYADAEQGLFIVSDGMGGQTAGERAAELVVERLPELLGTTSWTDDELRSGSTREKVTQALISVNSILRKRIQEQPELIGMGATVVLALVRNQYALVVHIGDSRAYRVRQGRIERLTSDHTLTRLLMDAGEVSAKDVENHPGSNQLTRYMGMSGELLPETHGIELIAGDRLLLCSDGLTKMLSDHQLQLIFEAEADIQIVSQRLASEAKRAGGTDNITVVVVELTENNAVQLSSRDS